MASKMLTVDDLSYFPIEVWDGHYHHVEVRFRPTETIDRDRGFVHVCVQNAGGFVATRRLTLARALRGKWHRFEIKRRDLAKRFLVEIEPLVRDGRVVLKFDGGRVRTQA